MASALSPEASLASLLNMATGREPIAQSQGEPDRPSDATLVQLVLALRREGEMDMSQDRVGWAMTDAFYAGSQWLGLSKATGMPQPLPAERGRPKIIINKFQKWIDNSVARLLSAHPQLLIKPGSSDDSVVGAARAAQRVIGEHEWRAQGMDGVLALFVPGYYKHGDAALKVEYNHRWKYVGKVEKPLRGPDGKRIQAVEQVEQMDPMTGTPVMVEQPAFGPDGVTPRWEPERDPATGQPVMIDDFIGRNETSYVSASDIFWEPAATRPEDAMWVCISTTRSPAFVYDRWNVVVEATQPTRDFDTWRYRRDIRPTRPQQTVQVDELWIKRGRYKFGPGANDFVNLPTGYVVVVAGNKLLSAGPNPYNHGEFPIIFERALVDEKRMRGLTPAKALRELQVGINKTASSICAIIDTMGDPQWLLPNGCNMPEADKRNGPGVFKRYDAVPGGKEPSVVQGVSAPTGTFQMLTILDQQFGADISGQHEGGLAGGAPAGVEAGVALEAIVERDTTAMAQIAAGIGRLVARWGYLTAKNIQQFEPERRQLAVAGEWNETEIIEFGGIDIYDSFEFDVAPNSYLPQSKAAEFQKDLVLLERLVLTPRDFSRKHGIDNTHEMTLAQKNAANARRENLQARREGIVTTDPMVVQMVDDQMVHIEEHTSELLDMNFLRDNPDGYLALLQHREQHIQIAMMQQAQAMAAQAQQAGGPPQGGGPSGGSGAPPPAPEPTFQVDRPGVRSAA